MKGRTIRQMVFPVLGMTFLQPQPVYDPQPPKDGDRQPQSPRFVMTDVGTRAYAAEIGGEFVVFEGTTARKKGVDSWTSYRALRDQLVAEGKLVDGGDPDYYVFA